MLHFGENDDRPLTLDNFVEYVKSSYSDCVFTHKRYGRFMIYGDPFAVNVTLLDFDENAIRLEDSEEYFQSYDTFLKSNIFWGHTLSEIIDEIV